MGMFSIRTTPLLYGMSRQDMVAMIVTDHHYWNLAKKRHDRKSTPLNLREADFSNQALRFINLIRVDLTDASFIDTDLRGAALPYSFYRARHHGALLAGASLFAPPAHPLPRDTYGSFMSALKARGYQFEEIGDGRVRLVAPKDPNPNPIERSRFRGPPAQDYNGPP